MQPVGLNTILLSFSGHPILVTGNWCMIWSTGATFSFQTHLTNFIYNLFLVVLQCHMHISNVYKA